jgi:hypothetical protein
VVFVEKQTAVENGCEINNEVSLTDLEAAPPQLERFTMNYVSATTDEVSVSPLSEVKRFGSIRKARHFIPTLKPL